MSDKSKAGHVAVVDTHFVRVIRDPELLRTFTVAQWTRLLRQARYSGLTGRIAEKWLTQTQGKASDCPAPMQRHLESARRVCHAQRAEVLREAKYIDRALSSLDAPVVLLKGAAYAVAGLPAASGRIFSDIDILVPKSHLAKAESLLTIHGWVSTEASEYNQKYYRQWMHELPPMRHLQRGTVLDVHHTILPETARLRPNAAALIAAARRLPDTQVLHVLAPADMVLHSMTHLFLNDDATHALRDLSDLDLLLRQCAAQDSLWTELVPRALALNLERPLFYAVQQLTRLMQTPFPPACAAAALEHGPNAVIGKLMDWIWGKALAAPIPPDRVFARNLALLGLYIRGHWLRMPPAMLARHLSIKALGLHEKPASQPETARVGPAPRTR